MKALEIAGYQVAAVVTDYFALDGGAMFGSVPKTLWNKQLPADEQNRIPLACRLLVLEGHQRKILVDVGMGQKWDEKQRSIFAIENLKLEPIEGITDVILTHLHFDHAGGITFLNQEGKLELTYPNATVYVSQENWEHANHPGMRERASYLPANIKPLEDATLSLTSTGQEILPGLTVHQADGHTHGLQWLQVGKGPNALAYVADLIPTAHHIRVPYVMGYDLCAETSMKEKAVFLEQAASNDWIVVFEHDRETPAAKITKDDRGRFAIKEVVQLP